jgi:hypothetical protein
MFKEAWTNVHDEEWSGRLAICSEWWCSKRWSKNLRKTALHNFITAVWIYTKFHKLSFMSISQLDYAITSFVQHGFRKYLRVHTKHKEWLWLWHFLGQYHKDGDEFLNHIVQVIGDETWVSFVNVEAKQQSKHTHSPNKPKNVKQTLPTRKLMAAIFWERKGVLIVEFMQQ